MIEIHMDPLGGVAGDMFVAALLDLRPDFEQGLRRVLSLCPLIEDVDFDFAPHDDGVLTGRRFIVVEPGATRKFRATNIMGRAAATMATWTGAAFDKR